MATALADDAAAREMLVGRYRVPQPRNALAHGGSRSRPCGDGCVRWSGRRSRQAVRGVRRIGRRSMPQSIPLSAAAAALLARGTVGVEAMVVRRRRLRDSMRDPRGSLRSVRAGAQARRGGRDLDRHGHRRAVGSDGFWTRRAGRSRSRACPTAISSDFGQKRASRRFRHKYLRKSTVWALRGVAPGDAILAWSRRFEAALLGRAGLLFMRPPLPRRQAWGTSEDLRQIQ